MSLLKESQHLKIPLKEIEKATNNFQECIGKGGYGMVYKGELPIFGKSTIVAVKRLNEQFGQGLKEFLMEIHLLTGQKHPNLITLLGYCDEGKEKIIVYEYAEHGSLDQYLRRSNTLHALTWLERLKICVDAARGLNHLHNHVGKHQTIIHRDIKSANILIDHNWVAKISDLGLSKLSLSGLNRSAVISYACGTQGYCEPEYFSTGIVKKESDVYSFGMVLFEVLCGRLCFTTGDDGLLFSGPLAKDYYKKKKLDEIVDIGLREQMSVELIHKFSTIAYECLLDDREQRPPMDLVVKKLEELLEIQLSSNCDSNPALATPNPNDQGTSSKNHKNTVIPDDFRCPIALKLMTDPVIVSTGQTYERTSIEKWLEAGHKTCPKTQQNLTSTTLIPNFVLRNLIAQWCESNGLDPPKRTSRSSSACTPAEGSMINVLLFKLKSVSPDDQRAAAGEIRLLAKRNADNRVAIAEAGAIPLLTHLLSAPDSLTQEHAVTALLNLSIWEDNKRNIVNSGAVPGIVQVLRKGSMEARENAAATLFSLSVIDENKVTIGSLGAIPPLVLLLTEGTQRGKKDAATALFNLCIYQGNKGRAVRAGVIATLMDLLTEPLGGVKDEALAILAILSSHPEGKVAIGKADAVRVLVEFIGTGSPRNKENAAAVLVHLCSGDNKYLVEAQELGVTGVLVELLHHGTDRGKRKAGQLLEKINRFTEQQKLSNTLALALAQTETETESNNQ